MLEMVRNGIGEIMTSTHDGQRKRSAVITGAGSGLGRDIALGLAAKGYRVFGTAMSAEEIADLKTASSGAVNLTVCDITNEAAVKAWAEQVSNENEGRLDLLISNAGILTPGPLEVLPLSAIRHEFEVNVFGALAVVNSFLPALRKARGRIVQVSTMTATLPFPFNGPSGASKAAFDAPDGPLKGNGNVAVIVLTWTIRPRAFRNAGRKEFTTARAPKTLTSNSCRMALSGRTSSGPGVRIPALLMRRSSRPSFWIVTSPAQTLTAASLVMSHWPRLTAPPDAFLRSAISSNDIAVPNTR